MAIILAFILIFLSGCSSNIDSYSNTNAMQKAVNSAERADIGQAFSEGDNFQVTTTPAITNQISAAATRETSLASYSTKFNHKIKAKNTNITLAAESINNIIVYPNETFSYNETVGPTTKNRGYKMARTFFKGQDTKGYGGGVCQVSSTLYNAVLDAGLEVKERHPHSKQVEYVPEDRDAATSYGGIDFKFVNNKPFPIKIKSSAENGEVFVEIVSAE